MRTARMYAIGFTLALTCSLCACGGGGGGGGGGGRVTITGVWTGTQTRVADGTVEYDFTADGTAISGAARLTRPEGTVYTGTFTGSFTDPSVDLTVTWANPSGYGTTHFTGTVANSQLSGNYTHTPPCGAAESGTVTLTKSSETTPTNLSGTYKGSSTGSGGQSEALTVTFTQDKDSLSGTATIMMDGQPVSGPVSGIVIGNHITVGSAKVGGSDSTWDATIRGNTISGNWQNIGQPDHGTFTITKQM